MVLFLCRFISSGIWSCVFGRVTSGYSKVHHLQGQAVQEDNLESEGIMILRNVGKYFPKHMTSHSSRLESLKHRCENLKSWGVFFWGGGGLVKQGVGTLHCGTQPLWWWKIGSEIRHKFTGYLTKAIRPCLAPQRDLHTRHRSLMRAWRWLPTAVDSHRS